MSDRVASNTNSLDHEGEDREAQVPEWSKGYSAGWGDRDEEVKRLTALLREGLEFQDRDGSPMQSDWSKAVESVIAEQISTQEQK